MSAIEDAVALLRESLASGPKPALAVEALAREAGLSERTLIRARAAVGVKAVKTREGWLLALPEAPVDVAEPTPPEPLPPPAPEPPVATVEAPQPPAVAWYVRALFGVRR